MARHKPVSKARWLEALKHYARHWAAEDLPERELARIRRYYLPLIEKHAPNINEETRILEVFCGPVCAAQAIEGGRKTWLDPWLDEYRRMHPGKRPKGEHISGMLEDIAVNGQPFDIILCLNGLDKALNPELFLNQLARLLAADGLLVVGMSVLPAPLARLRYIAERAFPVLRDKAHPYTYTLPAVVRALSRHFNIIEQQPVSERSMAETRPGSREYAFVCRSKSANSADAGP